MRNIEIQIPQGFSSVLNSQIQSAASVSINTTLMATKSRWEQVAQQGLTTTRADYLLGLNADDSLQFPDALTGVLTLRGKWPNMLEEGFTAFDMKNGFSHSARKHSKQDGGWFLTIPFRHRSTGTTGSAVGGSAMPDDIYAQARALRGGARLTGTEQNYPPATSWNGYQHKSGIYEGVKKISKTYDKATQNQYMSFRRVSNTSDPQSWWHPGFKGLKAIDIVESYAQDTFKKVFNKTIKEVMG